MKEDDEGVPFYLLVTPGMNHGDWNLCGGEAPLVFSMASGQKVNVSQIIDDLGHERD